MPRYDCELHDTPVVVQATVHRGLKGTFDAPPEAAQVEIHAVEWPMLSEQEREAIERQVLQQYHEPPDHDTRKER